MTRDNRLSRALLKDRLYSIIPDITSIAFSKIMGDVSIYELFISVPRVQLPRVTLISGRQEWNALRVEFDLDTPTIIGLVVLLGSIVCACSSLMLVWKTLAGNHPSLKRNYRIGQIVGLLAMILAYVIGFLDVLNNAYSGFQ